jgi:putative ABC transport system permease protein
MKADLLHRLLLLPYPRRFRQRHGADLLALYQDTFATGSGRRRGPRFWARAGLDAVVHGFAARWDERKRGRRQLPAGDSRRSGRGGGPSFVSPSAGRHGSPVERLKLDFRYGLRALMRAPGFTLVATLTLALAIGANTAIFSLVHAVLLRPLPFDEPNRIVRIYGSSLAESGRRYSQVSFPNLVDVADQATTFEAISVVDSSQPILVVDGSAQRLRSRYVMASYFPMLGVEPIVGRGFLPEEEGPDNGRVVLLTHGLWQRQFGSDPGVVGRTINLSGYPNTIVGVLPAYYEEARLEFESVDPEIYRLWPYRLEDRPYRSGRSMAAMGKLRDGVSLAAAQAEVDAIFARLAEQYPEANAQRGMTLVPMQESMVREVRLPLLLLLASVALVLLIGCANVANLLLARGQGRQQELAIRTALGASRRRLLVQLLTENFLLASFGGGIGLLLALATRSSLVALAGDTLPRIRTIPFDPAVLLACACLVLFTATVFGVVPAMRTARGDLAERLKAASVNTSAGRVRRDAARWLVVAEVALAMTLLAGAALMLRSFAEVLADDPGFDPESVVAAQLVPIGASYSESESAEALYQDLLAEVGGLPGIDRVGIINILPMGSNYSCDGVWPDDRPAPSPGEDVCAETRAVVGDYFGTMGIPVHSGRGIDDRDTSDSPPVVVISESVARLFWPGQNAVGKTLTSVHGEMPREIVGVVGDSLHFGLGTEVPLQIYIPVRQEPWGWASLSVVARTGSDPAASIPAMRAAVRRVDAEIAVPRIAPMGAWVAESVTEERFRSLLLGLFAATAVLLAAIGLYGVLATAVGQRRHEIGIRISLGATTRQILHLIIGEGIVLAAVGLVLGLAFSLAAGTVLRGLLYGVTSTDVPTLAAAVLLLVGVAFLACWLPARRAARVDPLIALRDE